MLIKSLTDKENSRWKRSAKNNYNKKQAKTEKSKGGQELYWKGES